MASQTATVETLTATVHVLMVGSRQVTLSVAKQLDEVPLDQLTVFGRVNIDRRRPTVIGADQDGRLALSTYLTDSDWSTPYIRTRDLAPGKITVCERNRPSGGVHRLSFDGRSIVVFDSAVTTCGEHARYGEAECGHWYANGLSDRIRTAIVAHDAEAARHAAAAASPLIVLAGLK